jgi:replicative DNA helicase
MLNAETRDQNERLYLECLIANGFYDRSEVKAEMFSNRAYGACYAMVMREHKQGHDYIDVSAFKAHGWEPIYYEAREYYSEALGGELDEFRTLERAVQRGYNERVISELYSELGQEKINEFDFVNQAKKLISKSTDVHHHRYTVEEAMEALTARVTRIPMGIYEPLGEKINFQPNDLMTITAETSAGKTALALNFLVELLSQGIPCMYFNMEMSEPQIIRRLASIDSGIPVRAVEAYESLETSKHEQLQGSMEKLFSEGLFELKNEPQTIDYVSDSIASFDQSKTYVVFIDHMGFVRDDKKAWQSNTLMLDDIMRRLRGLSEMYNCSIINISQMARPRDSSSKRVDLMRLKGSSEIEQSSVEVLGIERAVSESGEERYEISVLKARNGERGRYTNVFFNKENQRFIIDFDSFI